MLVFLALPALVLPLIVGGRPTSSLPSPPLSFDTGTVVPAVPTTPVVLTETLLIRYIAVQHELQAFFIAHPAALKAAHAHGHTQFVPMTAADGMIGALPIELFDDVAVAAQEPQVAAIFARHQIQPRMIEPMKITVYRALFAVEASRVTETPLDITGVGGANAALVQAHRDELAAVGEAVALL